MYKKVQIVSFDVPYPANYGGVIDVLYKLKALKKLGVDIILHTFEYGRGEQDTLKQYCSTIYYYRREEGLSSFFSHNPYIVMSRNNLLLKKRLQNIGGVIFFEGLHTTAPLTDLKNCKTIVRVHNIEHKYYKGLYKTEANFFKKLFFITESLKLMYYERILKNASNILTISPLEQEYFKSLFGDKCEYVPVFTDIKFPVLKVVEPFLLWHGDLRVSDNIKSALLAIKAVENTSYKLVIASSVKNKKIENEIKKSSNVVLDNLNDPNSLDDLFAKAKINLLFTFQDTGIKLKLLNALIKSRFVIANSLMIQNTGLERACKKADTLKEIRKEIEKLMCERFTEDERVQRKKILEPFDTSVNAKKIITLFT